MYFRKKRKVGDILGIAAAAMLLVGCGGRGVEDQARMEGVDTASQSHQNEAEAAIEGEISQDRTEETSQGGQQEQQERPEETLQDGQEGQPFNAHRGVVQHDDLPVQRHAVCNRCGHLNPCFTVRA